MSATAVRLVASLRATDGSAAWTQRALCARSDPDALFVTGAAQRAAARICTSCPVISDCLVDALNNRVEYGVWGGMTERQRRALLKKNPDVSNWAEVLRELQHVAS